MASRSPSPEPDDPREMNDFRVPEEGGPSSDPPEDEEGEAFPEERWEAGEDESDEEPENDDPSPQLTDPNRVSRDMATAALNTGVLQGRPAESGSRASGPADWRTMTDAEIMLRVREGDDTGFSFLIEKYRKPIINFMYRMVHNQAVAEELAQEVFLRVYRSRQTYRAEAKFST